MKTHPSPARPSPARLRLLLLAVPLATTSAGAWAQHAGHADPAPPPIGHAQHAEHAPSPAGQAIDHAAMGHATHDGETPMHAGEPVAPVTADALARAFPDIDHHAMQHASPLNYKVTFNRLEAWDGDHGTGQAWEGIAWIGSDTDRLWLRSEGEREGGITESADLELLYGRSLSPWWDVVAGLKQDFKPGDARTWAAVGVQGLAPYRFEVSATACIGERGQVAANLEVEYTLRITNRLILQPLVELDMHAKDEPEHGIGSGLGTLEAGLRLRYEFTRRFAPYVGVVHERAFGDTAGYRTDDGERARDTRVVAGLRLWF